MSIRDHYTSTVSQAQRTWSGAAESLADNVQKSITRPGTLKIIDPRDTIDHVFDFWGKTLEVQRDFVKNLAGVSVAVGETVRDQAETVREGVAEQVEWTKRAAGDQAGAAKEAVQEQAAERYQQMTKAELEKELASRDLPKTGTVDELRKRLLADDQK